MMQPDPETYAPGCRVRVRGEEWLVRRTARTSEGGVAVQVTGLSELVRDEKATFLSRLDDIRPVDPKATEFVADDSPNHRRGRLYLDTLLRRSPATGEGIHIGHRGALEQTDYQLVPAGKALDRPRPRILIADKVGLGKTVEAGILLSELIQRGRGDRILVVGLKSVLAQIQEELWSRFTIPLVRLDSRGIRRVRSEIPSYENPFHHYDRAIISIDTLKNNQKYRHHLENCHWDAVVIDECQHVAVRGSTPSQRARLAKLLSRTTDALIMTSATPHDGDPESFASLVDLLDPTAISNPTDFEREDIDDLFVRRSKKDIQDEVGESFREREVELDFVDATKDENRVFELLHDTEFRTIDRERNSTGLLFKTTLLKSFLSSPPACRATIDNRLEHEDVENSDDADAVHDRRRLRELRKALEPLEYDSKRDRDDQPYAKFNALVELLESFGWSGNRYGDRIVVFSERIPTLHWLAECLKDAFKMADKRIAIFDGSLSDREQQELVREFGTENGDIELLLGSDAAAEGINLHFFCHRLVHFDIPWSLITLEQRNGRIDRFGQTETPEIHYLLTDPEPEAYDGDIRIIERLVEKEDTAHQQLGDAATLMQEYDASRETERVGRGIEEGAEPEEVVPDVPDEPEESEDDQESFWSFLSRTSDEAGEVPECVEPYRLFDDDEYARTGLRTLAEASPAELTDEQVRDTGNGFVVEAPDDLKERYAYLPDELQRDGWDFHLTTDRDRAQQSLEESREEEDAWPTWELFWDLHPVAGWLHDRLLGLYRGRSARKFRDRATVLRAPATEDGLAAGEAAYIVQGVVSNRRSQPVLVDWFAIRADADGVLTEHDLSSFAADVGLDEALPNPGSDVDTTRLDEHLGDVVDRASDRMRRLREERADEMRDEVKEMSRGLKEWYEERKQYLEGQLEKYDDAATAARAARKRENERELQEMNKLRDRRREWFKQTLNTVPDPAIRVVAAVVPR